MQTAPQKKTFNLAFLQSSDRKLKVSGSVQYDPYDRDKIVSSGEAWQGISEMECTSEDQCHAIVKRKNVFYKTEGFSGTSVPNNPEILVNIPQHVLLDMVNRDAYTYYLAFSSLFNAWRFCKNLTVENCEKFIMVNAPNQQAKELLKRYIVETLKTWSFGDYTFSVGDIIHIPTNENITEELVNSFPKNYLKT